MTPHMHIFCIVIRHLLLKRFIIHQTHYEKSDWSRAFDQFTIACELDTSGFIFRLDSVGLQVLSTGIWSRVLDMCENGKKGKIHFFLFNKNSTMSARRHKSDASLSIVIAEIVRKCHRKHIFCVIMTVLMDYALLSGKPLTAIPEG